MFKSLLITLVLTASVLIISNSSKSQTLYFCEDVDHHGYPIRIYNIFSSYNDYGYIWIFIESNELMYTSSVKFVFYDVDDDGEEYYNCTKYGYYQKNNNWIAKKIWFDDTGIYSVYVYDTYNDLIAYGSVGILFLQKPAYTKIQN